MGEHFPEKKGLRKELAAFDLGYFGRAYLSHYFVRKSPAFHEELDAIWESGVLKSKNPLKYAKEISRMKGSRNVIAAPRGHAKSTNLTFKDSLHAVVYGYSIISFCYPILLNRQRDSWMKLRQNWKKMQI